jgi:predicted negative regulator of RcsB-dependent stress response
VKRNGLYVIIAVLAVAAGVLGYKVYQDQQRASGIDIRIGEKGISVETN